MSGKYLSKKESSTMLPELTEFVPSINKNAQYILYLHIFISWKKKGGAVH
jgi:hypothetical protein